jgi:hypothetical protein
MTAAQGDASMKKYRLWLIVLPIVLIAPLLIGCGDLGQVDQGRVVAYDKDKKLVTIIQDKKAEPGRPDYNTLPPHVYAMPADEAEIGAVPKPGKRMNLDTKTNTITIFDAAANDFKKIPITVLDEKKDISRDNPLVMDQKFPLVDKDKKKITVYSGRQKILLTFTVPEENFSLPEDSWEAGDEVRIYYHKPGVAQRFMNISKTDIFKK